MKYKVCNIKGFEGLYHIYEDGTIYSLRKKRVIKQHLNTNNYVRYAYNYAVLTGHDRQQLITATHRIVAHHFISPIIDNGSKLEVNHKDMNKLNNHYSNLELVTHAENIRHARRLNNWETGRKSGYKASKSTRQKMAEKKYKKVLCYNDNQEIIFNSIQEFLDHFNTYGKAFNRYVNSCKTFNGFYVRYLNK